MSLHNVLLFFKYLSVTQMRSATIQGDQWSVLAHEVPQQTIFRSCTERASQNLLLKLSLLNITCVIKVWLWSNKANSLSHTKGKELTSFIHFKIEAHFQIVYEENPKRSKWLLPAEGQHTLCAPDCPGWPCPGPSLQPTDLERLRTALVPLEAAYLPSAASSTPDIRQWGAWWIHPTQSRSDRCTLHRPWSWPFGREGRWWLCTGPAFAPGAAAAWKERKTIIPAQEQPRKTPHFWVSFVSV